VILIASGALGLLVLWRETDKETAVSFDPRLAEAIDNRSAPADPDWTRNLK
jgi:hypothetical protein